MLIPQPWLHRFEHDPSGRSPFLPGQSMSPNNAHALLISRTGYLPMPLSGTDALPQAPASEDVEGETTVLEQPSNAIPFGVFDAFTDGSHM